MKTRLLSLLTCIALAIPATTQPTTNITGTVNGIPQVIDSGEWFQTGLSLWWGDWPGVQRTRFSIFFDDELGVISTPTTFTCPISSPWDTDGVNSIYLTYVDSETENRETFLFRNQETNQPLEGYVTITFDESDGTFVHGSLVLDNAETDTHLKGTFHVPVRVFSEEARLEAIRQETWDEIYSKGRAYIQEKYGKLIARIQIRFGADFVEELKPDNIPAPEHYLACSLFHVRFHDEEETYVIPLWFQYEDYEWIVKKELEQNQLFAAHPLYEGYKFPETEAPRVPMIVALQFEEWLHRELPGVHGFIKRIRSDRLGIQSTLRVEFAILPKGVEEEIDTVYEFIFDFENVPNKWKIGRLRKANKKPL